MRNEAVSVGTTAFQLAPLVKEGEREIISIKNTSTGGQKVTIAQGIGQTAVSGSGIVLNAGESWVESIESTFAPSNEPYSIVADAANATIAFFERLRV